MNGFVDETLRHLRPAEVRVWLVLFRDAKPDGLIRTGQTDIARRAGVCVRAVGQAVKELVRRGLVQVVRRGQLNRGPSVYRLRGVNPDAAWGATVPPATATPGAELETCEDDRPDDTGDRSDLTAVGRSR